MEAVRAFAADRPGTAMMLFLLSVFAVVAVVFGVVYGIERIKEFRIERRKRLTADALAAKKIAQREENARLGNELVTRLRQAASENRVFDLHRDGSRNESVRGPVYVAGQQQDDSFEVWVGISNPPAGWRPDPQYAFAINTGAGKLSIFQCPYGGKEDQEFATPEFAAFVNKAAGLTRTTHWNAWDETSFGDFMGVSDMPPQIPEAARV